MERPTRMAAQTIPWKEIDTVLLDLDGTLLDKYFDDYFWEEYVPQKYAVLKRIPYEDAKQTLYAEYKACEGTLRWTDIDHWSRRFDLDIPALKEAVADRVAVHPGVFPFLEFLKRAGKTASLLTNAHPKAVAIKLHRVPLAPYFHKMISADDVGWPKENPGFWKEVETRLAFDKGRALFVDDNEEVLMAASAFGIRHLLYKSHASSRIVREDSKRFISIRNFSEITPCGDDSPDPLFPTPFCK